MPNGQQIAPEALIKLSTDVVMSVRVYIHCDVNTMRIKPTIASYRANEISSTPASQQLPMSPIVNQFIEPSYALRYVIMSACELYPSLCIGAESSLSSSVYNDCHLYYITHHIHAACVCNMSHIVSSTHRHLFCCCYMPIILTVTLMQWMRCDML